MAGSSLYQDSGDDDTISEINITPFVDVVLVLLVVFIVTAKLIVGVDVEKPTGTGGAIASKLRVSVKADGSLYVGGDPFTEDAPAIARIAQLAQAEAAAQPGTKPKVIITGDTHAAYGGVMHAITLVQAAGVTSIALENQRP